MKKQLSILAIAALTVSGFAVSQANADTVTYGPESTGTLTTDFTGVPLTLQLFDSNLGLLTGVSITITGDINVLAGSNVTNTAATSQSFTFTEDVKYHLSDGGLLNDKLSTITVDPSHSQDYTDLGAGNTADFGPYSGTANDTFTFNTGLSAFQVAGGGTDTINASTHTTQSVSGGGGNTSSNLNTTGKATVSVTYTYQAVPEPSTVVLELLGGCGMIFLLRRRRSVA